MKTPDLWGSQKWKISFDLPQSPELERAVLGAFAETAFLSFWQEEGTATPEDCQQALTRAILSWKRSSPLIGAIVPFVGIIPTNVLECNGATYDRDEYPELWALVDASNKTATEFTLPDLRGRFVLASGGGYNPFTSGGEATTTLTESQMPAHTHATTPHTHTESGASPFLGEVGAGVPFTFAVASVTTTAPSGVDVLSAGGGQAHNNMPPYYTLRYGVIAR